MSYTSGVFAQHARNVLAERELDVKKNTFLAYNRKAEEFKAFCNKLYSNDAYPTLVTEEKVFGFLYYQSHRTPKTRGRSTETREAFDYAEYERIMADHSLGPVSQAQALFVGYDVINQYLCAILKLWKSQVFMLLNRSMLTLTT
jgi:hypothetical protein